MAKTARLGAVLIDTNVLIAFSSPETSSDDRLRLKHFFKQVAVDRTKVVLATPSLAEFLCYAGQAADAILKTFEKQRFFAVAPFDRKAAVECAALHQREQKRATGKRGNAPAGEKWQKVKFDRQIVAIGLANNVDMILGNDKHVRSVSIAEGLLALSIGELPLPDEAAQHALNLQFGEASESTTGESVDSLPPPLAGTTPPAIEAKPQQV